MSELASVAQVSVGQIYRLFANKNEIIAAIVQEDFDVRLLELQHICAAAEEGRTTIQAAIHDLLLLTVDHDKDALAFEILAEAHRNSAIARPIADMCDLYRGSLRRMACVANPRLAEDQAQAAEELLLACLFGLGHRSLSRPRLSSDETATWVGGMILKALSGPEGA